MLNRLILSVLLAWGAVSLLPVAARADSPAGPTRAGHGAPAAARLAYRFRPGESYHYQITAFFTGHFPPFSQPNSPPVNLEAKVDYVATVQKSDEKGAQVAFVVSAADIDLLEKDPGPNGKVDPKTVVPLSLPLSEVQKELNVTALLRPDGSVASVTNASNTPPRVNLGFDLQKLFLLIMPVVFPDRPLAVNETWAFDDGVLGHNPGKTTYQGHLLAVQPDGRNLSYRIGQTAQALVDTGIDKAGNPTDKPAETVGTLKGKVEVTGQLTFLAPAPGRSASGASDLRAGRVSAGQMTLNVLLKRARTAPPDPSAPADIENGDIDVKARLSVQAENTARRADAAAGGTPKSPAASPAASGK
ncbi:MAG TPA: hypothetical protein VKT32_05495 [Chthonomonadaceae bacterium]|nr:hypothetical protein [Chthonomonadaceae bacterium]